MMIRVAGAVLEPPRTETVAFFDDPVQGQTLFALSIGLTCLAISGLSTMAHERAVRLYESLALTDDLTGLANRRAFTEQARRLARRAQAGGRPACALMMDVDHFSAVNERFGHAGGDVALAALAEVLRDGMRPDDIAARHGGEEFCALLSDATVEQGRAIAERLRTAVAALALETPAGPLRFTISIGVAALQGTDVAAALERADQALYRAKN